SVSSVVQSGVPHRIAVTFSEAVAAAPAAAALGVRNLTTSQDVPAGSLSVAYDATSARATFSFPGYAGGILSDGNYRATLSAGAATDAAGNALAAPAVLDFFVLAGDANGDRVVNFDDLLLLS